MTTKRIYIDFCTGEELKEKREITKTKVGNMTVAEMEARLKAGYEPIDVSIENWMRKEFDDDDRPADADTCSLCHVHYYNGGCHDCPLNMIGECCYTPDSAYQTAFKARNPQIMLDALYKAKAYVEEQKCKETKPKKQKRNEMIGTTEDSIVFSIPFTGGRTERWIKDKVSQIGDDSGWVVDVLLIPRSEYNKYKVGFR